MACKIPNIDEFLSALKMSEQVYEIPANDTAENIAARLEHSNNTVMLDKGRHVYMVDDYEFATTATTQVSKKFKKKEGSFDPIISAAGTTVHDYLEQRLLGNEPDTGGWSLSKETRERLDKIAEEITKYAKQRQNQINPKETHRIFTEQTIVNPFQSRSSKADVVVLFSDGSALLYDFKTRILSDKDWSGNVVKNTEAVSKKYREYEMQLGILGHDLMQNYGVKEIIGGRVIPIPIRLQRSGQSFEKKILAADTPFVESTRLKQALLLPEKTRIEGIDKFIKQQYIRIASLEAKGIETSIAEAEALREEVADIVLFHDFSTLVENVENLYSEFSKRKDEPEEIDGKPNPKYYPSEELEELYLKIKAVSVMKDNLAEYVGKLSATEKGKEKLVEVQNTLGAFSLRIGAIKNDMDAFIANRIVRKYVGDSVFEDDKLKQQRGNGMATGALLGLADQQNYRLRALNELKTENERFVSEEFDKFLQDWAKVNENVSKWIKTNGRQAFIDIVYDAERGSLVSQLVPEFFEERKKAIAAKNIAWFKEHYEPNYTQEEYENRLKAYLERLKTAGLSDSAIEDKKRYFIERNNLWGNSISAWSNNKAVRLKGSVYRNPKWTNPKLLPYIDTPIGEFLNFYRKSMYRFLAMVDKKEKGSGFVPWIRQSMTEAFMNNGFDTKALKESMLNIFASRNDSSYLLNDDLGKLEQEIPVYFVNPRTDEEGNVLPGETKSLDFMNSLLTFGKMAIGYQAAKKNVAIANMLVDSYVDSKVLDTDLKGNLRKEGAKYATRDLTESEKEFARALRDYYWYGIEMRTKDRTVSVFGQDISAIETARFLKRMWTTTTLSFGIKQALGGYVAAKANAWIEGSKGIYYNSEQWTNATRFMVDPNNAQKYLALGLYMDVYTSDFIDRKLKAVGMEDKSYWDKQGSEFVRSFQDRRYSDFFRRNLTERLGMGVWAYESERRDNNLVATVAQNYGVDPEGNFFRFKRHMFEKDGVTLKEEFADMGYKRMWDIFEYDNENGPRFKGLDKEKSDAVFKAFRQAIKRIRSGISGETNSEDTAYVNLTLWGQLVMHYRSWMPGILREWFGSIRYDNRSLSVHQGRWRVMAKHLFQDTSKTDAKTMNLWGAALSRLGEIVVEMSALPWAYRKLTGGDTRFKPDLERIETEYTLWKANNPDLGDVISLEDYIEMREGQLNAMIQELRVILAMIIFMYGAASIMAADEDDEDEASLRFAYSIARKAYSELSFTINPTEYIRLTKNPIPLISIPERATKALGNTFDEMRDFLSGENSSKDRSGFMFYTKNFVPGWANVDRLMEWSKEGKEYLQEKPFAL